MISASATSLHLAHVSPSVSYGAFMCSEVCGGAGAIITIMNCSLIGQNCHAGKAILQQRVLCIVTSCSHTVHPTIS